MLNKTERQKHEENQREKIIKQCEKQIKKINLDVKNRSLVFKNNLKLYGNYENSDKRNEIDKDYILKHYSKNDIISVYSLVHKCKKVINSNNKDNNYIWYLEKKIRNLKKI